MALGTTRERLTGLRDVLTLPLEWVSALTARISCWMTQERWTNLLTIGVVVLANLVVLIFLLQGQDNRAIAFTILALLAPLAFFVPELSVVVFITAGSGLFVNAMYFAAGPGGGTGERTLILLFFGIVSARAIYEYVRIPRAERPHIFSWFIALLLIFWGYYMLHVGYIYIFLQDKLPYDNAEVVLGYAGKGIFRYFDAHMLWIGILPLIVLLRDVQRMKRVAAAIGIVLTVALLSILWEYFAPLPFFWKVLFQLRAAGETEEGYRIRDPAGLYIVVLGFFFALYSLGYYRGWKAAVAVVYIALALYAVLATKNRALWGGMMAVMPLVLLWKPPQALLRQLQIGLTAILFGLVLMLHPVVSGVVNRIVSEAVQRWERNYAFGGDPRSDPSYLARVREREAWEIRMERLTLWQRLFGAGLEADYGRYVSLTQAGIRNPRFTNVYILKTQMHFPWLARQLHIGLIGTGLLALLLIGFFIRAAVAFFSCHDPWARSLVVAVAAAMVSVLAYDSVHSDLLDATTSLPVVLLWSVVELAFHWKRTNQLAVAPPAAAESPAEVMG